MGHFVPHSHWSLVKKESELSIRLRAAELAALQSLPLALSSPQPI